MPAIKGKSVLSRRRRVTLVCTVCGSAYDQHEYRALTSKYCSKNCWNKRAENECLTCGKKFGTVDHYGKKYCSKKCSSLSKMGENHPMWKDGNSLDRNRARQSGPLARWKKQVKERDGACTRCGDTKYLHAHHIKDFSTHPEIATEIDNGVTLCEICHSKEHGRWIGPKSRKHKWEVELVTD